ncbi:sugar ABC transporter ATP-binding protein, partial [Paraclostridium benzoelyticum]
MELKIENLSVKFKECLAVNSLNLDIKSGELVSLLGPSGCGKSTTIYTLAGIYKPNKGSIYFGNNVVNEIKPENRNIGMVFQNYSLYPHMKVYDNIAFPLKLLKKPKDEIKVKVSNLSKLLNIDGLLDRKPAQLSGGQQQRVAIARALAKEPQILLLDEPLSNLDARLRVKMREEIRKIQKKMKITTIFVTHDQEEAMSISDKIAIINNGTLQQFDTPMNLYRNPKNLFVAKFLGNPTINLLNCHFNKEYTNINILNKFHKISDDSKISNKLKEKKKYIVAIRSEDIKISKIELDGYVMANIDIIENLGKDIVLKLDVDGKKINSILPSSKFNYEYKNV